MGRKRREPRFEEQPRASAPGGRADGPLDGYAFVRPSFAEGAARMLDLSGSLDAHDFLFEPDADARALASDWAAVGRDLRAATGAVEPEAGAAGRRGRPGRAGRRSR